MQGKIEESYKKIKISCTSMTYLQYLNTVIFDVGG